MAETTEAPETLANQEGMEVEVPAADSAAADDGGAKRTREEAADADEDGNDEASKKPKLEKSAEEEEEEKNSDSDPVPEQVKVNVGPKTFGSSVEMYDYFYKLLHSWTPNLNVNKYEHVMLLDLLKKGHLEPDKKIGSGACSFQIRFHPKFRSRCFFIIREDESVDDFSFRKCVDHILPLPEDMQVKQDVNRALGRGRGGGGRGGGRGGGGRGGGRGYSRGRGGRHRN